MFGLTLTFGILALAAFPASFISALTVVNCAPGMFLGCVGDDEDVVFKISFYGMCGFTLLAMVSGAIASFWGPKATIVCLRIGIGGQVLSFLGSLAVAQVI